MCCTSAKKVLQALCPQTLPFRKHAARDHSREQSRCGLTEHSVPAVWFRTETSGQLCDWWMLVVCIRIPGWLAPVCLWEGEGTSPKHSCLPEGFPALPVFIDCFTMCLLVVHTSASAVAQSFRRQIEKMKRMSAELKC
jgi:hypothetical protein